MLIVCLDYINQLQVWCNFLRMIIRENHACYKIITQQVITESAVKLTHVAEKSKRVKEKINPRLWKDWMEETTVQIMLLKGYLKIEEYYENKWIKYYYNLKYIFLIKSSFDEHLSYSINTTKLHSMEDKTWLWFSSNWYFLYDENLLELHWKVELNKCDVYSSGATWDFTSTCQTERCHYLSPGLIHCTLWYVMICPFTVQ